MRVRRAALRAHVTLLVVGLAMFSVFANQPIVFSVLYNESTETPFQEDWLILQEYARRRGVQLDIIVGDDENYAPAVATALESGQAPDIILKVWPEEAERYAASGMLLPFSEYGDFMPYFRAYIEERNLEGEIESLQAADGKLYILPGFQRGTQVQQWIYREDLFSAHALATPETYDELYDALLLLRNLYADSSPLSACWGGAHVLAMMGAGYGIPAGWNGTQHYDATEDAWRFAPATEAYRELLRYLHRCYLAGILDPAIYNQSFDEYLAKIQDGRAFVTVTWISSGFASWNRALEQNGIPGGKWAPLPVPESTLGLRALPAVPLFRKGLVVPAQVASEPYLEDLLRFLDWAVYSEEGRILTAWGVEGMTYQLTDSGRELLPHIISPRTPNGDTDLTGKYGFATLFDLNENAEFEDYKRPTDIACFLEQSREAGETLAPTPSLRLNQAAQTAIAALKPNLDGFAATASERFVIGELSLEEDWGGYLQELENRGYRTLEAIWNTAWDGAS